MIYLYLTACVLSAFGGFFIGWFLRADRARAWKGRVQDRMIASAVLAEKQMRGLEGGSRFDRLAGEVHGISVAFDHMRETP